MIIRIPQRAQDDCTFCALAMVMGTPYSYERVLADSERYAKISDEGKFLAWWEIYLQEAGFRITYRPFSDLYNLHRFGGSVVGLLGMDVPHLQKGHVVALDELGIVDPADNAPDHIGIQNYVLNRIHQGVKFHDEFLAITRSDSRI